MHPLLRTHHLPDGRRARLRLPHRGDARAVERLADGDQAGKVLRFDPRRRLSVVATMPGEHGEEVVGAGTVERGSGEPPELLAVSDPAVEPMLRAVLEDAAAA